MISATTNYKNALATFAAGRLIFAVEIAGYSRVLTNYDDGLAGHFPWLLPSDDYSYTVNPLDGGADVSQLTFHAQDFGGAITADFPGFVFEGKKMVLKQGFVGLAYADYVTLFTGYVSSVDSANSCQEYDFTCSDHMVKLSQVIYQTGDDGQPTSGDHLKTVTGHPVDILVSILEVGCGIDAGDVDTTTLYAYRDGPFSGLEFVFHLDQAPAALDFIKNQIMKPLGGYFWVNSQGKFTVNFSYPLSPVSSSITLGKDFWTAIPLAEQLELIDIVQFQFDKSDDASSNSSYLSISTQEFTSAISKYGLYGEQVIAADGLRSAFQGFFIAAFVSRLIFQRYGAKALLFDQGAAESRWPQVLMEPGDIVAVTHPNVPDRIAGVIGITNKLFEVFNKTIAFATGLVTYSLLDATYLSNFGQFLITPDGEADYAAASTADKAKYMFMTDDTGHYSNGDAGNGLG